MDLALFDLDNTLIRGDSDFEWAQFLINQGVLEREVYEARNLEFYEQYKAGTLDIEVFLDFQLQPLAHHPRSVLEAWREEFLAKHIRPIVNPKAKALVRAHLESGALCAVVTATNSFVTAGTVREFGVAHLIATIPAQENGEFTGRPRGIPSFREGKIVRVEDWFEAMGLWWCNFERSWFYSDSLNDIPLLSRVTHPVAVDPDPALRARAEAAGWPIITLLD